MIFIVFEIWWFFLRASDATPARIIETDTLPAPEETLPEEVPVTEQPVAEPTVSPALLSYERIETITLTSAQPTEVLSQLSRLFATPHELDTLYRVVLLVQESGASRQTTYEELLRAFAITIPPTVQGQLSSTADLFFLGPSTFDEATCKSAGASGADCSGPRLGLAVQTAGNTALESSLRSWEGTMIQNLKGLIRASIQDSNAPFQSGSYRGISLRYKNLPLDTTSIDYAVTGDLLIITTSKSSMFSALEHLSSME